MISDDVVGRRTFLEKAGLAALSTAIVVRSSDARSQITVPNSEGGESPKLKAPPKACDCHIHIYDPARFSMVTSQRVPPTEAAVPQYRLLQKRIGTTPHRWVCDQVVDLDAASHSPRPSTLAPP